MINQTIEKIRKDFSNQIIFLFCSGNTFAGIRVVSADYDIENKEINYSCILPGIVQEINVIAEFSTEPAEYHISGDIGIELIRPEVKFYD